MSETQTAPRRGRPKKTTSESQPVAQVKKTTVVRKEKPVNTNREYSIMGKGGIVTMIPMRGVTIYDEDRDTVREIRYCPNEPSIYMDEQSPAAKRETIIFNGGKLFVPKSKPNLRLFLDKHPQNKLNGGSLFEHIDHSEDKRKEIEREFATSDAIIKVRDTDIQDLLPVALFFNIDVNISVSEIRHNLLNIARKNPQDFMNAFDDPTVISRSLAKQASDYQFIAFRENGVYWYDTNKLIVAVPVGRTAIDVMTRFMLTEQGATVYSELEDKLSKLA
jgi:hypothetical protein